MWLQKNHISISICSLSGASADLHIGFSVVKWQIYIYIYLFIFCMCVYQEVSINWEWLWHIVKWGENPYFHTFSDWPIITSAKLHQAKAFLMTIRLCWESFVYSERQSSSCLSIQSESESSGSHVSSWELISISLGQGEFGLNILNQEPN